MRIGDFIRSHRVGISGYPNSGHLEINADYDPEQVSIEEFAQYVGNQVRDFLERNDRPVKKA